MMSGEYFKNIGIKFLVLTLLAYFGPTFLNKFIVPKLSFLGTFANTLSSLIVIFVLLLVGNWILNKSLGVVG